MTKKRSDVLAFLPLMFFFLQSCHAQQDAKTDTVAVSDSIIRVEWTQLAKGVEWCETDAPFKSVVNDSRLTLLRIDPKEVEFEMFCATELDRKARTVVEWADSFRLDIVFNAGMYDLGNKLVSRGYLRHNDHFNNANIHPTFNSMLAFNPVDSTKAACDILDMECNNWATMKTKYRSYAQGLRMLDCHGKPMNWTKRKQSCSMLVMAKDSSGKLWMIFTRSPYLHNDMIAFLQQFPEKLTNAIYMEGGPETSLYANVGGRKIEKVGSYVSQTYETDKNDHFWPLPNVIGIRLKEN